MKVNKKNKKNRYDFGSFVEENGKGIGAAAGMFGQVIGGSAGSAISSAGSGAAIGTSIAPGIGTVIGAGLGLVGGILGNAKKKRAEKAAKLAQNKLLTGEYNQDFNDQLDTNNLNPYGEAITFKMGGAVPVNRINIEKGELQIDPTTGKILREYSKINPETGGMYEDHSKSGKDTKHNFVSADPGTFIITKKTAKDYKDAVDNNDKLHKATILQNINNAKADEIKTSKFEKGGGVKAPILPGEIPLPYISPMNYKPVEMKTSFTNPNYGMPKANEGFKFNNAMDMIGNYAPAALNIGQGLFGKVETQAEVAPIRNRYTNQILNSMPEDVSLAPARRDLMSQQNLNLSLIKNGTNGSPISRANMSNVIANTSQSLGKLGMDQQMMNNQVAGQRANILGNLGAQDMQAGARAQQINLGIRESNQANRAAKQNLLTTGIGQAQQVYQNDKTNNSKMTMDKYKVDLLKQMFPNLKFYGDQFGSEQLMKLIGK